MKSQLAVIILNYFDSEATINCVNSVQRELPSIIFLVDNSANGNESNNLKRFFEHDATVHMLFPTENLGFSAGVNLGIRIALNEGFNRFLLLNNDAVLLGGAGSLLSQSYIQWPAALIAPAIRWGGEIHKGSFYHKYLGLIVKTRMPKSNDWLYYLTGCALAFDSGFLEKVGLMNEKFFMYGEDIELSFRAYEKGVPVKLIDKELVYHEGSQSAGMASFFYEYHLTRMHYLLSFILFKNPLQKAISILSKIIVLTIRAIVRSIRFKSWSPLTALMLAPLPLKIRPKKLK